jgi:hypothetical protein
VSIRETLDQLRDLQAIDEAINALETELQELPGRKEAAREDHAAVEAKYRRAQADLEAVQKTRRGLEQEIADSDQSVIKFENDKLRVKTNEEFRALNHQIELVREKKSRLEDAILLSYDEEETAGERARKLKAELEMVARRRGEQETEIAARAEEDVTRLAAFTKQRTERVAAVDPRLLARYEAIRMRKGGTAVVSVVRGACGGCHTQQPPQKVNEIRKEDVLHTCDFCGRFLLWSADGPAPA